MGDISRHRDIYLNTRGAIPQSLLDRCHVARADLTYLELGNYLTDVSQFRDPVSYIFAKRKVWRERVLGNEDLDQLKNIIKVLGVMAGASGAAYLLDRGYTRAGALVGAATLPLLAVTNDLLADIADIDDWIDKMLGVPIDGVKGKRRTDKEYGRLGQFFQHFIEGITHLVFAQEATERLPGPWGTIERIPEQTVKDVFEDFFTQYYPHEHTDQPPYEWDASKRHDYPKWYGVSRRQRTLESESGIMNAVDKDYVEYLAEGLSDLELEMRKFTPAAVNSRRMALVRLGKILHGVEDWFFHSNVVELIRLRFYTPARREGETEEAFVRRFVKDELGREPAFSAATPEDRIGLQRRLYRIMRFPVYEEGTWENSAGIASKDTSTLRLDFAYPAFPSQQDTAHTLLGALENLEGKFHGRSSSGTGSPWMKCLVKKYLNGTPEGGTLFMERARARGVAVPTNPLDPAQLRAFRSTLTPAQRAAIERDAVREWLPLVLTLMDETERQRLVANVDPLLWTGQANVASLPKSPEGREVENQMSRHARALQPKLHRDQITENNYERAIRFLAECGSVGPLGQKALNDAFKTDFESLTLNKRAPGAGGFLIKFALQLQEAVDTSDAVSKQLNEKSSLYDQATDNGAFEEIIGSHSLMSKDTVDSSPFFDDATVMASVASQSILHILLEEISSPPGDSGLDWQKILRHFIRYPVAGGWERRAMLLFRKNKSGGSADPIPKFADLPELARLRPGFRGSRTVLEHQRLLRKKEGTKAAEMEEEYIKLEREVSPYRYPRQS